MEVHFDFAVDNAAQSLDEARRFVIGLPLPLDGLQRRAGFHCERALMNDLIAGIQFG